MARLVGFAGGAALNFELEDGDGVPVGSIRLDGRLRAKAAADATWYYFLWTEAMANLAEGVTISGVVYAVPSTVDKLSEAENFAQKTSFLKLGGGAHGGLYPIVAIATLSDASTLELEGMLRVFN